MRPTQLLALSAVILLGAAFAAPPSKKAPAPPKSKGREVTFNRDIRPILSEYCYKCHGPDSKEAKGGVRLDLRDSATKERRKRFAIKPGDPGASALLERVADNDSPMPPENSGLKRLDEHQIGLLREWIKSGAKYEAHWAFVPPKKPALPAVKDKAWVKDRIDSFVLAQLEEKGLKPAPQADKATLLRRASLTLTGILPTAQEMGAYMADKSPDAYEKAVDRLLDSPRYGENQARYWLDAVRYGDTHGLHLDNERAIYPYRDWVVRAFNEDLPYEQFIQWQMAGDLLPNPTLDMKIATGYVRMNPTTAEGGAIEEEFQVKNTFDRVDTTSTVLLGLTTACAKCHDHKYDPITMKDYYSLFAYFNSTADAPMDGNQLTPEPTIKAPTPEETAKLESLKKRLAPIVASVPQAEAESWLNKSWLPAPTFGEWEISGPYTEKSFEEAFDTSYAPEEGGGEWRKSSYNVGARAPVTMKENSAGYFRVKATAAKDMAFPIRVGSDDGIKVIVNGKTVHSNRVLRGLNPEGDNVVLPLRQGENILLFKVTNGAAGDEFQLRLGDAKWEMVDNALKGGKPVEAYLKVGPVTDASTRYRTLSGEIKKIEDRIPSTLVAKELDMPRKAFILRRGEYNLPTTEVGRAIPAALGSLPKGVPNNRLGLAKWISDPKNPLAARVWVNRIWQQHFGTGIVKTSEDFGNQGEYPSDPDLLDDLAVRFTESGGSLKKLHRWILTSSSYKQSAEADSAKRAIDPENRLISRGPRFRLDGEVIRDNALAVSGLLQEFRGGRGFKPYQPAGIWEALAFTESNTSKYSQDKDAGIYRRSLYMFWKRTSPHPVMLTFDAPMREACSVRRARTNTPLQALVTLNEPAFVEAARFFAQRILQSGGNDQAKVAFAFRSALGRAPKPGEEQLILSSLAKYRQSFALKPEEATQLLSIGLSPRDPSLPKAEHAAWTVVASTLFNLDEFLTQH